MEGRQGQGSRWSRECFTWFYDFPTVHRYPWNVKITMMKQKVSILRGIKKFKDFFSPETSRWYHKLNKFIYSPTPFDGWIGFVFLCAFRELFSARLMSVILIQFILDTWYEPFRGELNKKIFCYFWSQGWAMMNWPIHKLESLANDFR